ncbi:MAG: L,D-transpeptidase family protein, partial [Pontibacter sp.]|nr:L,D-transpeptidase family protein [Pontibacter sp.]
VTALNVPPQQRLEQLRLNLSRFEAEELPSLQEPYAILNIPDYTLQLVDSGHVVLHMHVIVGEPELKTYPIHSELDMVVLYPYWYVPRSIAVKEIVPILRRNPGYLQRKNMRLERPTASGWVRVNPWNVDWHQVSASNFNYRIVQLSGEGNELGRVKFPFPNRLPQYLHDTPHKALFEYPDRAFSHGCIRLEKPEELANYLLAHRSGYSEKKIERLWQQEKPNHYLRVKEPLPLHIVYFTAWVDARMQVQFRKDVYGFDKSPHLK